MLNMVAQNFLQGYMGGIQGGRQVADMRRQQELQNAFSQYGPGLVSGDQEAINAFAAIDPMTALQVQQRQDQARRAEQTYNMQVQEHVARMSAAEKAQAAAEMDQALSMMSGINDPASWDQVAQEYAPDLVGQFGQKDLLINRALGLKDALAMQQPPKPADEYERYRQEEEDAGRQPLSRIDYAKAKQKSMSIEVDAEGNTRIVEGPSAGKPPKTTEGEKAAAGYLGRMKAAEQTLSELSEDEPAVRSMASLLVAGTNLEGLVLSERQELILQAQRDWVRAKLRKESGAVIGEEEMAEEIRTYFPLPGDSAATIEQKRKSRLQAERQMATMGGAAVPSEAEAASEPSANMEIPEIAPDFLSQSDMELWDFMEPNERAAILKTYEGNK